MHLLPDVMMIVVGCWYWGRSRHAGFALFAAAFALHLAVTLLAVLVNFFNRVKPSIRSLLQASPIIACVLMIVGLRGFLLLYALSGYQWNAKVSQRPIGLGSSRKGSASLALV